MGTVLNLKWTLFDLCTITVIAFKYIKKPHWYGSNIYVVSCISGLSATSGKVEMQTLRTWVDGSLLFFFKLIVHLLSTCLVDINVFLFVICLSTILLFS